MTRTRVPADGLVPGSVVLPSDSRLTDARTPTAHKASHATGGTDAIAPADIGAAAATHTHTASQISDSTTAGRTVLTAADAAAQRTAIGAAATSHTHAAGDVTSGTFAIGRIPTGTTSSTVCIGNDSRLSDSRTPTSHTHGNITNAGAIGSTANLPIITTTSGVLTAGSFGTAANTFCVGNDSRLSDARTPTSHTHGNISNAGAIGSTANLPVITTTSGVLTTGTFGTTANTFCQGNDSRLSDARTPTTHTHTASQISDSTADGRTILTSSNVYACRAWVNFNGTANTNLSGTYSQSGTTVTVTITGHGLSVGQRVNLDFTSGTATDQAREVATVANANTFTCTLTTSATTSGNVTVTLSTIRDSGNVSSVSDLGVGVYAINFATAAPHANYAVVGSGSEKTGTGVGFHVGPASLAGNSVTTSRIVVAVVSMADGLVDVDMVSVAIFY